MIDRLHGAERDDTLPQRPANLAAGRVARVQHAADAVGGLEAERQLARRVAIEPRAPLDQLAHVPRAFLDEHAHGRLVAQSVAGANRVASMERGAVVGTDRGGNAALRVAGVALGRVGLGQNQHAAGWRERNRGAQSGDAAADDDEVEDVCGSDTHTIRMLS